MARAGRSFEEGRIYHVYNRVGGGAKAFTDEELAATFVALLRLAMGRDGAAVLAWRLFGNHYHLKGATDHDLTSRVSVFTPVVRL